MTDTTQDTVTLTHEELVRAEALELEKSYLRAFGVMFSAFVFSSIGFLFIIGDDFVLDVAREQTFNEALVLDLAWMPVVGNIIAGVGCVVGLLALIHILVAGTKSQRLLKSLEPK